MPRSASSLTLRAVVGAYLPLVIATVLIGTWSWTGRWSLASDGRIGELQWALAGGFPSVLTPWS